MRRNSIPWVRAVAGALVLSLGLCLTAPPAGAAEASASASSPSKSLAATAARLATLDASRGVRMTQAGAPAAAPESASSFFKSPKGILSVLLMVGVTAYTIHSRISDHLHSQVR